MNGKLDKPQGFWAWPPRNCWKCPDFSMLDINVKQVTWPVLGYQMVSASLQVVGLQNDERPSNLVFVTESDFWLFQMAWLPMGCSKYFCTSISRSPTWVEILVELRMRSSSWKYGPEGSESEGGSLPSPSWQKMHQFWQSLDKALT